MLEFSVILYGKTESNLLSIYLVYFHYLFQRPVFHYAQPW